MQVIESEGDFTTNVKKAFDEIDSDWQSYNGLVIAGRHFPSREDFEQKIFKIAYARENNLPYLGICYGFQLMIIEYARNVLGLKNANTQELDLYTHVPIIEKMKDLRVGQKQVILYGQFTLQSFWHNYKMNLKYLPLFAKDWIWSVNQGEEIVDYMALKKHWHFIGVQFHPEYQSSKDKPHLILKDFLEACKKQEPSGVAVPLRV